MKQGLFWAAAASLVLAGPALADTKKGWDAWQRGDYRTAIEEWRGPAIAGDADAQFNLGAADERVAAAVLLNPRLLFWDPEADGRRELRRVFSVLTPSGFRQLLRAERPFARLLAALKWAVTRPFRRSEAPASELDAILERLRARGQSLELAFSGNEPLHDELRRSGEDAKLTIHTLPFRSHTLKPLAAQAAAHAVLDAAIERAAAQ